MFCHFGINTYAGHEWTDGKVPPEVYAPPADIGAKADAWVKFARDSGMRYFLCITKHHDGFCLWNSKYTDYSVGSPKVKVHTDVVKAVSDACKKYGVGFAVYYSSWDRHDPSYADPVKYTAYMKAQLTELLTNYGPVCEVWFDGSWDKKAPGLASARNLRSHQAPPAGLPGDDELDHRTPGQTRLHGAPE